MKRNIPITLALMLYCLFGFAQRSKIDSLTSLLDQNTADDTTRINITLDLARAYFLNDQVRTKELVQEAKIASETINYHNGIASSLLILGNCQVMTGKYDSAHYYYTLCKSLSLKNGSDMYVAKAVKNIGAVFYYQGDYDKAIEMHKEALEHFRKINDQKEIAMACVNIGVFYKNQDKYLNAISYYQEAALAFQEANDSIHIATVYNNIGSISQDLGEDQKALEYFNSAYQIWMDFGSSHDLGVVLNNIGGIMLRRYQLDSALVYFRKSLLHRSKIEDEDGICQTYYNIGSTYLKKKKYDSSLFYLEKSIDVGKKIGAENNLATAYGHMADYQFTLGNLKKSKFYANRLNGLAKDLKSPGLLRDSYFSLYRIDSADLNFKSALSNLNKYVHLKDSIFDVTKARINSEMLTAYEVSEKQKKIYQQKLEISQKSSELIAKDISIRNNFMIFYAIIFLLTVVSGIFFINSLQKTKSLLSTKVENLKNQLNPHFLYNSLNVLSSLIFKEPAAADKFLIKLSRLYRYILDHIDQNLITIKEELEFARSFFEVLEVRFGTNIKLQVDPITPQLENCYIPPMSLQVLIENAIKHNNISKEKPLLISVKVHENERLIISNNINKKGAVFSNGIGLSNLKQLYRINFRKKINITHDKEKFEVEIPIIKKK